MAGPLKIKGAARVNYGGRPSGKFPDDQISKKNLKIVYFGFVFAASSIGTFYFSFGLLEKHIYNHKLIMQTCIYTKERKSCIIVMQIIY